MNLKSLSLTHFWTLLAMKFHYIMFRKQCHNKFIIFQNQVVLAFLIEALNLYENCSRYFIEYTEKRINENRL